MSILTSIELVFWNLDRGAPPSVASVRQALSAASRCSGGASPSSARSSALRAKA